MAMTTDLGGRLVWHVCPSGMRTSWTEYSEDPTETMCQCCHASFIYTTAGWVQVAEESP